MTYPGREEGRASTDKFLGLQEWRKRIFHQLGQGCVTKLDAKIPTMVGSESVDVNLY